MSISIGNRMLKIVVLLSLISQIMSVKHFRLTTSPTYTLSSTSSSKLTIDDYLYSTMGIFRIKLQENTCQMKIQEFSEGYYKPKGFYPQDPFSYPCKYLQLDATILYTEHELPILFHYPKKGSPPVVEGVLTIDDMGVIRLITKLQNQQTIQSKISIFRTPNKYLYPTSNLQISPSESLPLIINQGFWGFSSRNGQFIIFNSDQPKKSLHYSYQKFQIKNNKIIDNNYLSPPSSSIQGITYEPKCGYIEYMNFKFPLVFAIDSHWPQLRLLDQGGYQILSVRYPQYHCNIDLFINPLEGQKQCVDWFCPDGTFQFDGKCVISCPFPYFHQIKPNKKNRCVLVCEEGSFQNQEQRVCSCDQVFKKKVCPNGTFPYALGCFCTKQGTYYNGVSCTAQCPLSFVQLQFSLAPVNIAFSSTSPPPSQTPLPPRHPLSQPPVSRLCIKCPYKCLKCSQQTRKVASTLLICKQCLRGYTLYENVCKRQCNLPNDQIYLNSASGIEGDFDIKKYGSNVRFGCWSDCGVEYCQLCVFGDAGNGRGVVETCLWCTRPLILFRNMCLRKCPQRYIMRSTQDFRLYCQQIKACQSSISSSSFMPNQAISSVMDPIFPSSSLPPIPQKCVTCDAYIDRMCWINCNHNRYFNALSKCLCLYSYDTGSNQYGYSDICLTNVNVNGNASSTTSSNAGSTTSSNATDAINTNVTNSSALLTSTIVPKQCPLTFYLYQLTGQCLPCPFGCLTCLHDAIGQVECTSCSPSYFLMIDIKSSHFCQRDSSLSTCQLTSISKLYNPLQKVCSYKINPSQTPQTSTVYTSQSYRLGCLINNPNCLICAIDSLYICTFCLDQYYLYNHSCVKECPMGYFKYQKSCIKGLSKCQIVEVRDKFYFVNVSQAMMDLQGYRLFLPFYYETKEVFDPIGYMFLQLLAQQQRDNRIRIAKFPYPYLQCIQCTNGLDMNPYTGRCQPCFQSVCLRCPNSVENVCYQCHDDYKLDETGYICVEKSREQKNCKIGQWRDESGICVSQCRGYEVEDRGRVNCSKYCNSNPKQNTSYKISPSSRFLQCQVSSTATPTLSLLVNHIQLTQNISLAQLIPIQSSLTSTLTQRQLIDSRLIELFRVRGNKQPARVSKDDILYADVDENGNIVMVVFRGNKGQVYGVQMDVIQIYGQNSVSNNQQLQLQSVFTNAQAMQNIININSISHIQSFNQLDSPSPSTTLYLPQSLYILPQSPPPLCSPTPIQTTLCLLLIYFLILTIIHLHNQTTYKLDNIVIYIQMLVLFYYGLQIKLNDVVFYRVLFGWKWAIGFFNGCADGQGAIGGRVLDWGGNGYVEVGVGTGMAVVGVDGNVVRHCLGIIIALGILFIVLMVSKVCLHDQTLIFWKSRKSDIILQPQQASTGQSSAHNLLQPQPITTAHINTNINTHPNKNMSKNPMLIKTYKEDEIYRRQDCIIQSSDPEYEIRQRNRVMPNSKHRHKHDNKHKHKHKQAVSTQINTRTSHTAQAHMDIDNNNRSQNRGGIMQKVKNMFMKPGNQYHKYNPLDIDHYNKFKLFCIFIFQSCTIFFVFFAVCTLYSRLAVGTIGARVFSVIFAIILSIAVLVYAVFTAFKDHIAGVYMFKRVLLAVVLAFVRGQSWRIALCIPIQLIFALLRFAIQEYPYFPVSKLSHRQQMVKQKRQRNIRKAARRTQQYKNWNENSQIVSKSMKINRSFMHIEDLQEERIGLKSNNMQKSKIKDSKQKVRSRIRDSRKSSISNMSNMNNNNNKKRSNIKRSLSQPKQITHQPQSLLANPTLQPLPSLSPNPLPPSPSPPSSSPASCSQKLHHYFLHYKYTIILIIQQLLIIITYILLSLTDKFVEHENSLHIVNSNKIFGGMYRQYQFGLVLIVCWVMFVVCLWAIVFGVEAVWMAVEVWGNAGLTLSQSNTRDKALTVNKLHKYWKKQTIVPKQQTTHHLQFLNELTYNVYEAYNRNNISIENRRVSAMLQQAQQAGQNISVMIAGQNKNKRTPDELDIFNYQISEFQYAYLY